MTNPYAKLGDHNYHCDECFRTVKASTLRKRWDNAYVCDRCYEKRNPAEYKTYKAKSKLAFPTSQSTESLGTTSTRSFIVTDSSGDDHSYTCGNNITMKKFDIARNVPVVSCSNYLGYALSFSTTQTSAIGDSTATGGALMGKQHTLALNEDGTLLASGMPDSTYISNGGGVAIYERTGDAWAVVQRIANPDASAGDLFGQSVAMTLDGETLVIGAPGQTAVGSPTTDGRVYVYTRTAGVYSLSHNIGPSDDPASADFGSDVAISGVGTWLVVGAPLADKAYIYKLTVGVYVETKILTPSLTAGTYGGSLAMNMTGEYIAIGDHLNDTGGTNKGAVFIYYRDQGGTENWGEQQAIQAGIAWDIGQEQFGRDVAFSCDGSKLMIGCSNANRIAGAAPGGVREGGWEVWQRGGVTWSLDYAGTAQNVLTSGAGEVGKQVGIASDGGFVLAGGPEADVIALNSGVVELYTAATYYYLNIVTPADNEFGAGLALSNDNKILIIGASGDDTIVGNAGQLYYFRLAS